MMLYQLGKAGDVIVGDVGRDRGAERNSKRLNWLYIYLTVIIVIYQRGMGMPILNVTTSSGGSVISTWVDNASNNPH